MSKRLMGSRLALIAVLVLVMSVLITGCVTEKKTEKDRLCGDGICDEFESPETCPRDCGEIPPNDKTKNQPIDGSVEQRDGLTDIANQSVSGVYRGECTWSGEILVAADTTIDGNLTIRPGTVVRFSVPENFQMELRPTGKEWDSMDPTYTSEYCESHTSLNIAGKLIAKGTPERKIMFTSNSKNPTYCDWEMLGVQGDGSIVEYAVVEYATHGISLHGNKPQPNTLIRNTIINHSFTCALCSGSSGAQLYNNKIWGAGHEGIDVQGGNPVIENNSIFDAHGGVVVVSGSPVIRDNIMKNVGSGVFTLPGATPIGENNEVELAPPDSKLEWRFLNFAYQMRGDPVIYN
jgi:hypothetical protein